MHQVGRGTTIAEKPMLPAQYLVEPQLLTGNVVYVPGGKLLPELPADPDLDQAVSAELVSWGKGANHKLPNGLSLRRDIFARLVARGATGAASYRAAFRPSGDQKKDARNASTLMGDPLVGQAIVRYRDTARRKQEQNAISLHDFVKGGLVKEAQTAPEAGARIRAYELLGKTEAMFTDVRRTEKAISPSDLKGLKDQLEQRLRSALHRLAPHVLAVSPDLGTGPDRPSAMGDERNTAPAEPHPGGAPLIGSGGPAENSIVTRKSSEQLSTPLFSSGTIQVEMAWGDIAPIQDNLHRELTLADLGL